MRVFLTGSTGFIGRQVFKHLRLRGHEVLGSSPKSDASDSRSNQRIDLLDPVAVDAFLASNKPDGLIHLAWDTTPGAYWESPANLLWTGASLRLLESFARNGGRRAVIAGTSAEYSWDSPRDLDEAASSPNPDSLYGVSKDSLRRVLEAWAPDAGVSLAWGRIFCPFGPHEKPSRLIPKLISRLNTVEEMPFDSGSMVRDFLHVEDIGEAFAALLESGVEGAVNLASGEALSIREVLTIIGETLGRTDRIRFDELAEPEGQAPRVVASVDRLRQEVGWSPSLTTKQRLSETCLWWASRSQ